MNHKAVSILCFTVLMFLLLELPADTVAANDIDTPHRSCDHCGMDRKAYGYSRMLIEYEDGTSVGVCSLHCAVVELDSSPGGKIKAILVADRDSRLLIDAEQAFGS